MEEKKSNKKALIGAIAGGALALILVAAVAVLMVVNIRMYAVNNKLSKFVDDEMARQAAEIVGGDYVEDGFVVGDSYEIKSTKAISDAYKNKDASKLSAEDKETYDMAVQVIDEVITDEMKTDYEKEVAIYDWIVDHVSTGESTTVTRPGSGSAAAVSTPHGVLQGRHAVCVGYATTFRLLVNMLGMDCHIVHNEYHSWDLVKLDDGEWYHVDIYMDSEDHSYRNFNMTDEMASSGHEWMGKNDLPSAVGIKYTYANQNAQEIREFADIPKMIYERGEGNNDNFSLFLTKAGGYANEDFARTDALVEMVNSAFNSGQMSDEFMSKSLEGSWSYSEDGNDILCLYVTDAANSSGDDVYDDVDMDELGSEVVGYINDAFGTELIYGEYYGGDWDPDYEKKDDWSEDVIEEETNIIKG